MTYTLPILQENGELTNFTDSLEIFYFDEKFLIQIPYTYALENSTEVLKKETRFSYFFYLKGSNHGFYFDKIDADQPQKLSVDSFLIKKTFKNFNFYDKKNDSLVLITKPSLNETRLEKYVPKKKLDQSYPDTTYLYYDKKFNDVDLYSFSRVLDSSRKMKLFKIEMKYNSQYYPGYNFKFPQRLLSFQLKESHKLDLEIIELFEKINKKIDSNTTKN